MATLGGYYLNPHVSQFDGSKYENENCTPTSVANGANASTGGKVAHTGGYVRSLIPRSEESDPLTPGWSMIDADHANAKMHVPFINRDGDGWLTVLNSLAGGHYVDVQGESWEFSNNTCSGAFNGAHCIGIHPATRVINGLRQHWIDDPICKTGRWEYDYILHRYAQKLALDIWFGVYSNPVPKATPPKPPITGTLHVAANAKVMMANISPTNCIQSWTVRQWPDRNSSASARKPVVMKTCSGAKATVAYVTNGVFKGRYVHIGTGVTWTA